MVWVSGAIAVPMSIEERKKLMQDGKCLCCKKPGHILKDCPLKNELQKEINGIEMHKHVQSLIANLRRRRERKILEGI
jgi:hypothetical protein